MILAALAIALSDPQRVSDAATRIAQANPVCAAGCGKAVVWHDNFPQGAVLSKGQDGKMWILVSPRLLERAATEDELAFVIAHEMAHNFTNSEDAADAMALVMMDNAGYDRSAAARLLSRFSMTRGRIARLGRR